VADGEGITVAVGGRGVGLAVGRMGVGLAVTVDGIGFVAMGTGGVVLLVADEQAAVVKMNRTASIFFIMSPRQFPPTIVLKS
jgi:hypothetical protein